MLSEIAPNFGRFFCSPEFSGISPPKRCTQIFIPSSQYIIRKSFLSVFQFPTDPKVIGCDTLNFGSMFKFSLFKIVGGQGSVKTHLQSGGMYNNPVIANCPQSVPVK